MVPRISAVSFSLRQDNCKYEDELIGSCDRYLMKTVCLNTSLND